MNSVLVTGVGGFLGRAVYDALHRQHMPVVGLMRPGFRNIELPQIVFCDLSDSRQISYMLEAVQPSIIVNCAAVVDFRPGKFASLYPVNVTAAAIFAAWSAQKSAQLVQISTAAIHGAQTELITATTPIHADTDYARTKLLAEQAVEAAGCEALIVRFGGIYGRNGPVHLGVNRAITQAIAGIRPTVTATGCARRNYISVTDAAMVIVHCVKNGIKGVHLSGGPETLTIRQILQIICDRFLPGLRPDQVPGDEARDQVIESSPLFPRGQTISEYLAGEQ